MKKTLAFLVALGICIGLISSCTKNGTVGPEKCSVRLNWVLLSTFSGFVAAKEKGFFQAENLDVTINPGSVDLNPAKMVVSGSDTFGILEPAQIIVARANQGLPLVMVGLTCQETPFTLMSLKEKNILEPKDLIGKIVGYNPLNDVSYLSFLEKNGIDRRKLKEEPVQFDLARFFEKKVDVWPSFITNEVLAAKEQGFEVNIMRPDDYGIHIYEMALFTTDKVIREKPDLVRRFVKAWVKGWIWTINNQEEAVKLVLKNAPTLDYRNQREVLEAFIPLISAGKAKTKGFGWIDPEMIDSVQELLIQLNMIKETSPASELVDSSFIRSMPDIERKLN